MSKKVNPIGFRLGISTDWTTKFYLYDYINNFKKQLLIQNLIYYKLKKLNVKIMQYSVYKELTGYLLNINIYVAPYDINAYISKLLFYKYFSFLLKKYKKKKYIKRNKLKQKAQLFAIKYVKLIQRFYFLSLILVTLRLENMLTTYFQVPIKIYLNNYYYYNFQDSAKAIKKKLVKKFYFYARKNKSFKVIIELLIVALRFANATLINQMIVQEIQKVKKHFGVLKIILLLLKNVLKFTATRVIGIKVQIAGKLNGKLRTKNHYLEVGLKIPIQTFAVNLDYSFYQAYTYTGVFGIRVWLYFKN